MNEVFKFVMLDWHRYVALHKNPNFLTKLVVLFHNPGFLFSIFYRIEFYLFHHTVLQIRLIGYVLYPLYFILSYYVFDIDIPPSVVIGKGLYIHYKGIVFSQTVKAGNFLTLIGPFTVGMKGTYQAGDGVPELGNFVYIFSGARVLGKIKVGDNVYIGANAVVLKNIQSNSVVGGVPAKYIKKSPPLDKRLLIK